MCESDDVAEIEARLATATARCESLIELICNAAPLTWTSNRNFDGASEWEKKALKLIREDPDVILKVTKE